jgi:lipoate-protein ligase A
MELDQELFKNFNPGNDLPLLRFFQFSKPTFTLGRLEARREGLSLKALPHPYESRPTGGWAVLHGPGDICYSIIASTRDSLVGGDLLTSYQKISGLLQKAFQNLGRSVELSQAPHRAKGLAHCFSAPSKCELVLNGKKVSGGAQAREGGAFLQQGAVLLTVSQDWQKVYPAEALQAMTGLNDAPGPQLSAARIEEAVVEVFVQAGAQFQKPLTPLAASSKL